MSIFATIAPKGAEMPIAADLASSAGTGPPNTGDRTSNNNSLSRVHKAGSKSRSAFQLLLVRSSRICSSVPPHSLFRPRSCKVPGQGLECCPRGMLEAPGAVADLLLCYDETAPARRVEVHHSVYGVIENACGERGAGGANHCMSAEDRKSTRLNSSHKDTSRMPSSA